MSNEMLFIKALKDYQSTIEVRVHWETLREVYPGQDYSDIIDQAKVEERHALSEVHRLRA